MAVRLRNGHTHVFVRRASVAREHIHGVVTTSGRAVVLCNGQHVHRVHTLTTFDREHAHAVRRWSGLAIPLSNGTHTHRVRALTTVDLDHRHSVNGLTRRAPNVPPQLVRAVIRFCRRRRRVIC